MSQKFVDNSPVKNIVFFTVNLEDTEQLNIC